MSSLAGMDDSAPADLMGMFKDVAPPKKGCLQRMTDKGEDDPNADGKNDDPDKEAALTPVEKAIEYANNAKAESQKARWHLGLQNAVYRLVRA